MTTLKVKNREDLQRIINLEVAKNGYQVNLNHLDVSSVTDMNHLFYYHTFNGDISQWDVSNVTNMAKMFSHSQFNGDISRWDTSNVSIMELMFERSVFNGDISRWNVSNVTNMRKMFEYAEFTGDVASWVISPDCNATQVFDKYHESPLGLLAYLTKERPLPRAFKHNPEYQRALKLTQSLSLNEVQAAQYIYQHLFKPKPNDQELTFSDFSL